jgi:hypothetical protein
VMDIHNRTHHTVVCQSIQHMINKWLSSQLHQRLWSISDSRAHPCAKPGSQHHCGINSNAHER